MVMITSGRIFAPKSRNAANTIFSILLRTFTLGKTWNSGLSIKLPRQEFFFLMCYFCTDDVKYFMAAIALQPRRTKSTSKWLFDVNFAQKCLFDVNLAEKCLFMDYDVREYENFKSFDRIWKYEQHHYGWMLHCHLRVHWK